MELRTAGRVTHFVVLKSGEKRVFSIENARAGRDVLCDLIDWIRLEGLARCQIRFWIDHQLRQIGLIECFDARGQRRIAQNENRCAVFARDPSCLDRDVKTIFHARCREHDARAVAVAAEDRLMQIALLDVSRQTGARTAPLNVTND